MKDKQISSPVKRFSIFFFNSFFHFLHETSGTGGKSHGIEFLFFRSCFTCKTLEAKRASSYPVSSVLLFSEARISIFSINRNKRLVSKSSIILRFCLFFCLSLVVVVMYVCLCFFSSSFFSY